MPTPELHALIGERVREGQAKVPCHNCVHDGFCVPTFVRTLAQPTLSEPEIFALESLSRKIEVGRQLFTHYSSDLKRGATNQFVDSHCAEVVAGLFLWHGLSRGDWKWLNTALKMSDGILLAPALIPPDWFVAALKNVFEGREA